MKFRKLRIAWSVVCGIACVLLLTLWLRSYKWGESYYGDIGGNCYGGGTLRGVIILHSMDATKLKNFDRGYGWGPASGQRLDKGFPRSFYGFYGRIDTIGLSLVVPIWFLMLGSCGCAIAPWLRWKFTVRTLLITTTLIACLLGLSVLLSR